MATRTQVAQTLTTNLQHDRAAAIKQAAAWLSVHGKTRQAEYLAKDVAWLLEKQGYVYAKVTTAKPLTATSRQSVLNHIKKNSGASDVELNEIVDPEIIGGVRIETPASTFDDTVKNTLQALLREVEQ